MAIRFDSTNHVLYSNRSAAQVSMGFFKELTDGERASLLSEMEETSPFAEGVDIVRQGTQGDSFYVIKSGRHALSPCPSPSRRAHGAPVSALVHRPMPI